MRFQPSNEDGERTPPSGIPMGPGTPAGYVSRDDTTRYLCAAAHLDSGFATSAIKEFLVEPTRAVPPSPGVDAAAVLGEAVAARTRRKIVNAALILLLVGLFFAAPFLLLGWLFLALIMSIPAFVAREGAAKAANRAMPIVVLGGVGVLLYLIFQSPLGEELLGTSSSSSRARREALAAAESGPDVGTIFAVLIVALILGILVADRFVVWRLVTERFSRQQAGRLNAQALLHDRQILQYSPQRFVGQLNRHIHPRWTIAPEREPQENQGNPVPVIVYRGYDPFVGAGSTYRPWSIAVPLQRIDESKPAAELSTAMLYDGIAEEIGKMRGATALTPGMRLRELMIGQQVIVPAGELIDHLADPAAADFLQGIDHMPYSMISERRALAIRDDPIEWARYYLCFQVETWDRDLVMSIYLHVAMDDTTLYVEWTPCLLRPIKQRYQHIDSISRSTLFPIGHSILDLFTLPMSVPERLVHTVKLIRPLRRDRGVIDPDMFGSLRSLREMAADANVHNYFQLADQDRYLKILESRFVRAVATMMHDAGYATASFEQQAATVFNTSVHIGGSVTGNVVAGTGNVVSPAAAPASAPTPPPGAKT